LENPLFAVLQPPSQNISANSPIVGFSNSTDTAQVNRYLEMEELKAMIPDNMRFAWTFKPLQGTENVYSLIALKPNAQDSASMDGSVVVNARQNVDERGRNVVSMSMNSEGGNDWALITRNNVDKSVAITLDGMVYSYPVVNEEIRGGSSQISGDFDVKEAKDLATVLKAGQLPIPARIESEETVGPTLGASNIKSGYLSFLGAFVLTLIFMAFYYAKAGIVADLALLANLVFILGCSAAFTIVLTLPGIAAVVLTVGMAVDANVLIFERIREEMAKGKTLKASIKAGFSNAFSSVMDANITTFLTGVVLYAFGVGPIKGFAVSLMIGIITSLISALIITRLILDYYADKGKDSISFGFPFTTGLFDRAKLNMVDRRKTFYIISGVLVVISLTSFAFQGLKTGVDFDGGRQFVIQFVNEDGSSRDLSDGDIETIRGDITTALAAGTDPVIKTLRDANRLQVTTSHMVEDRDATGQVIQLLQKGLDINFSGKYQKNDKGELQPESALDVGPTVAGDIKRAAGYAVIFSLLIIFLYILVRFRKWQYSLGAIAAIFHDVIIVLGVFSILQNIDLGFSVEINQAMIAAILTIIGYSINDTVVVFDRIRENLGEMKASKLSDIYNISIDQTISRTLITSVTTLLTATTLFLFGGDVIRGFIFAIMVGIIVGTYSSIFVASPISLDLLQRGEAQKEAKKVS
ncbi:protein translocase subunit SecD, partial [bacterium]|nr:protein translocase subunit SecD [bacterium]